MACFTHGAAPILHGRSGDLHTGRADELSCAAPQLGVEHMERADHPDGALVDIALPRLAAEAGRPIGGQRPGHLLLFDTGNATGRPDHRQATGAALLAAHRAGRAVPGWSRPQRATETG